MAGGRYVASNAASHGNPNPPAQKNVRRQPNSNCNAMIRGGAMTDPIATPLLNTAIPKARSRTGNHSAITFAEPGQFPASPNPSRNDSAAKLEKPVMNACPIAANDQIIIETVNPILAPK